MTMLRSWAHAHPAVAIVLAIAAIGLVGGGVYWFAAQRLVLDRRVDEALPSAPPPTQGDETAAAESLTLASGRFRSLEHSTSGRVSLIELADGRRFLRLEELATSNGPDLRVYLTDRPVSDDWFVWDDGEIVDLGGLKGNVGSSNYRIPSAVDVTRFETAVVWCRRFTVGFGVAPLDAAG